MKLYICDWSGTIVDDRPPVFAANMLLLAAHGVDTESIELEAWFNNQVGGNASRYLARASGARPEDFYDEYARLLNKVRADKRPAKIDSCTKRATNEVVF